MKDFTVDPTTTAIVWDWVSRKEVAIDPISEAGKIADRLLDIEWPSQGMLHSFAGAIMAHTANRVSWLERARKEAGEKILTLMERDDRRDQRWPDLAELRSAEGSELWQRRMLTLSTRAESLAGELQFYKALRQAVEDRALSMGIEIQTPTPTANAGTRSVEDLKRWALAQAGLTVQK